MQDPGKDGGSRRLAVCPAHQKCCLAARHKSVQGLGHGTKVQSHGVELPGFRVLPDHGIADDDQIRGIGYVLLPESVHDSNALFFQKMAHGGINLLVGAGDFKPKIPQHTGKRSHTGTADGN